MNRAVFKDLIIFMTFSGDNDQIALPRFIDRLKNRFPAVSLFAVWFADFLQTDFYLFDYLLRVFATWIVRCHNHHIA